jgi:hypothetical protein
VVCPRNHSDGFLQFGLKTGGDGFFQFGLKTDGGFLVEPQNQSGGRFPGLGLKTGSSGLVIWGSKSLRLFLSLGLKTKHVSVCRLRHKIDGGGVGAGHASRTSSLLSVEASLTRVFQSDLETGGGATTGGARVTITEVASEVS